MTITKTERLILREYVKSDLDGLYAILSDAENIRYYPAPYDEQGTRRWLDWCTDCYQKYGFGLFAIELKETGEFIGDCGISIQCIDGELLPEIGYHISKRHWRRGYAKEAALAVRDWFFENTDHDAVFSYMTAENLPSYSTAASIGMSRVKEYSDEDNVPHLVYKISREQWEKIKRKEGEKL
jgi:RimJ/RimL family protein N-acetyltransferase